MKPVSSNNSEKYLKVIIDDVSAEDYPVLPGSLSQIHIVDFLSNPKYNKLFKGIRNNKAIIANLRNRRYGVLKMVNGDIAIYEGFATDGKFIYIMHIIRDFQ